MKRSPMLLLPLICGCAGGYMAGMSAGVAKPIAPGERSTLRVRVTFSDEANAKVAIMCRPAWDDLSITPPRIDTELSGDWCEVAFSVEARKNAKPGKHLIYLRAETAGGKWTQFETEAIVQGGD